MGNLPPIAKNLVVKKEPNFARRSRSIGSRNSENLRKIFGGNFEKFECEVGKIAGDSMVKPASLNHNFCKSGYQNLK